ncbi:MAG: methionyl-tRNA formyltransferase [Saprospiraceae bacterium]|nr:methionyl-tRNA formyltransferase [Saprospiraceae bacterium]
MKIDFFLMTFKGFKVLESIIHDNFLKNINSVIIGKDDNVVNDYSTEIQKLCISNNIKYYFRSDNNYFKNDVDLKIAISWRWLIDNGNKELIVFHDSLLPKYRGFSPLVNMLIKKEREIGVTALYASENYDAGEIIDQRSRIINYPIKIDRAIEKVSELYCELVLSILNNINSNKKLPNSTIQDEKLATYSLWRDELDYHIDWNQSSEEILNFINAVSFPYKGACSYINDKKVRILDACTVPDVNIEIRHVGKVIFSKDEYPVVVCGKGLLQLTKVVNDENNDSILPLNKFRIRFN